MKRLLIACVFLSSILLLQGCAHIVAGAINGVINETIRATRVHRVRKPKIVILNPDRNKYRNGRRSVIREVAPPSRTLDGRPIVTFKKHRKVYTGGKSKKVKKVYSSGTRRGVKKFHTPATGAERAYKDKPGWYPDRYYEVRGWTPPRFRKNL